MLRNLINDLESALSNARAADLLPLSGTGRAQGPGDSASLSQWLPYRAYLEDQQVFINRDALGFCLEVRPQSGADEDMARVLTALYASSPVGTGIQFHLLASPDIRGTLGRYADLRLPDEVVPEFEAHGQRWGRPGRHGNIHRTMARRRVGHYLAGARHSLLPNQSYLLRNFRLILSVSLPGSPENLSRIDELLLMRDGHRATLHAAGFPSRSWTAGELINWVSALVDPHRQAGEGIALTYDPGRELRDQMIDRSTQLDIGRTGIDISNPAAQENCELRLLSVRSCPARFALWNMGSLIGDLYQATLQYPCPFMITLGVHVLDPEATRNWAYLKSARATTNATSYMARFLPDMQERKLDWDIVLKAMDDGKQLVSLQHQVALFAPRLEMARAEQSARSIFRARGFELSRDTMMMTQGLIGSLPMTMSPPFHADLARMKRVTTKTSANAVHLAPLIAEWQGTGTPVLLLGGRRGQLMQIDVYDNPAGNYNVAIAGTSGSGKSLLLNEIAASYLGTDARVWIIDVGRSYEKACRNFGGSFIEFTENAGLSLNPFSFVDDIDEDMELLQPLLAQMVSPREPLEGFQYSTLGAAIKKVWKTRGREMTVTDIHNLLATGRLDDTIYKGSDNGNGNDIDSPAPAVEGDRRLKDLAAMLQPYTLEGTYGKYFDSHATVDFSSDFIVLELEELKAKKDLQTVVLLIMMYRITREMYFSRDRKKIVIIDEAWDLLSGGATAEFIEAGYRRARKYKGAFMSATQGVDDYYRNPAAKAALDNSDWMFLLRQKPESVEMMDKLGQVTMDDAMKRLLQSLRTEHGAFSEVFIHSPAGNGVGRLIVDPYSLLLFSSRAEDFSAINAKRAAGMTVSQAIEAVLIDRGQA
ncbi:type IV secretion system protein TraC [Candidatus Skiveiella danica]|uniref:type IV secretion system protein TraC n=1 Tax=Candidatus Skiveiella danica TaxID=3386177 RepID=UPI0009D22510|nr:MAG: AAA-like domain protein [Alphaproteobacteria bacterium ADurb.Bin100]